MKTTKQILVKNTLWLTTLEVFSKIIMFFVTVSVVRYFGAEDFGRLNYAQSFVGICMLLSDFGLNTILIRDISGDKQHASSYLTSALVLKGVSSLLVLLVLLLIAPVDLGLFLLVALFLLTVSTSAIYTAVLSAYESMQYIFATRLVHYLGILASVLLVIQFHLDLHSLVLFYFLSALLSVFVAIYFLSRLGVSLISPFDQGLTKKLLLQSLPIFGMLAINQVYLNLDTVMIRHSFSAIEVGYYQAAYKILFAFQAINLVATATFPRISALYHEGDIVKLKKLAKLVILGMSAIFIPFIGLIYLFSPLLVKLIYGASYLPASPVLPVLLTAGLLMFYRTFISNYFLAANKERLVLRAALFGLVVNTFLNYFLIPRYGFTLAGISLVISEIMILLSLLGQQYLCR